MCCDIAVRSFSITFASMVFLLPASLLLYGSAPRRSKRADAAPAVFRVERLRQQVVGPWRPANAHIEPCEAERFLRIVPGREPELRRMIGERLGVIRGQCVVAIRRQPAPTAGLVVAPHFAEDARELCGVVGIVASGR